MVSLQLGKLTYQIRLLHKRVSRRSSDAQLEVRAPKNSVQGGAANA